PGGGRVEQGEPVGVTSPVQVGSDQLGLDGVLASGEPVHRRVHLVGGGVGHTQVVGQGVGVGPGRPASLSAGGFPWPALRTGHAISTASGSPRVHAAGTGDPSTIGAASSASRVPGTRPRRGRATDRRYSPANSPVCFVAANTLDPSPCDRLSRPRTTTGPPPHPGSISRRRAFPPTSRLLAGEGTAGMVPTFTVEPFDGVGAQLCPCNIATATPQAFTVASRPATSTGQGVPHTAGPCGCALLTSPDLPGLSWWCA